MKTNKAAAAKPARYDAGIRIDADVVAMVKKVTALRGTSIAQYVSDILRPVVRRDLAVEHKALGAELARE